MPMTIVDLSHPRNSSIRPIGTRQCRSRTCKPYANPARTKQGTSEIPRVPRNSARVSDRLFAASNRSLPFLSAGLVRITNNLTHGIPFLLDRFAILRLLATRSASNDAIKPISGWGRFCKCLSQPIRVRSEGTLTEFIGPIGSIRPMRPSPWECL